MEPPQTASVILLRLGALPLIVTSYIAEVFSLRWFHDDLSTCEAAILAHGSDIPPQLSDILISAEDHRYFIHPGIDAIAILRAVYMRLVHGARQGASTIEQQLVRTITRRHELTLRRKIREQILAIALCRKWPKYDMASTYLSMAFYGSGLVGKRGLCKILGDDLHIACHSQCLLAIAQLKYPKPLNPTVEWQERIARRVKYIDGRRQSCHHVATTLARTPNDNAV